MDKFVNFFKKPAAVILALSFAALLLNLYVAVHYRPFNSDDVSWQNILLSWRPWNGHTVYLGGSDNFILKLPFFWIFGHFLGAGRKVLFAESAFFALLEFTLFYLSSMYFLSKFKIKKTYQNLLPFLWLASFGYAFAFMYLNPILRNFEIGLSFVYFVLAAKLYYEEINWSLWWTRLGALIASMLSGALIYNDPYFLYYTLIPIFLLFLILFVVKKVSGRQLAAVVGFLAASAIFMKITSALASGMGIKLIFSESVQFVSFDKLAFNIETVIHEILILFGADFFGQKAASLVAIVAFINLAIVVYIFTKIFKLKRAVRDLDEKHAKSLWLIFFGSLSLLVVIVGMLSNLTINILDYRYLVMLAFSATLFLAMLLNDLPKLFRKVLSVLLILAIIGNVAIYTTVAKNPPFGVPRGNIKNAQNEYITDVVKSLHLTKGYTAYWEGNINTYFAKGTTQFLPIHCIAGKTKPFPFLLDGSRFDMPASKSFYMIDPSHSDSSTCSLIQVLQEFGPPQSVVHAGPDVLFIYNYDIIKKM
jgi:hypothetical protein